MPSGRSSSPSSPARRGAGPAVPSPISAPGSTPSSERPPRSTWGPARRLVPARPRLRPPRPHRPRLPPPGECRPLDQAPGPGRGPRRGAPPKASCASAPAAPSAPRIACLASAAFCRLAASACIAPWPLPACGTRICPKSARGVLTRLSAAATRWRARLAADPRHAGDRRWPHPPSPRAGARVNAARRLSGPQSSRHTACGGRTSGRMGPRQGRGRASHAKGPPWLPNRCPIPHPPRAASAVP